MGKGLNGLEFQKKAKEDTQRLKVTIKGQRSDGFSFTEDSQVFDEEHVKCVINLIKKKRMATLLENVFDYEKYGKAAGKIPEELEDNEGEVQEYKRTRQAELTIKKLKECEISFPEDVKEHPVPRVLEFLLSYVDGTGTYPVFLYRNGKRIL